MAGLALQDALPQAKPSSGHSKLARQHSKGSCTLPVLSRQTSGAGAGLGRSSPPPRQFARTASMFVMPDRGPAGPLHRTGSSTLQGLMSSSSTSPRGRHPEPIAKCSTQLQALALGHSSPAGQLGAGQQSGDPHCSCGNAAQADAPTPMPEEAPEAELAGAGLTARCSAAARTWSSLQGFSALRVVAQDGRSTVWEAVPMSADQQDLPGGCGRGMRRGAAEVAQCACLASLPAACSLLAHISYPPNQAVALKAYSKAALGRTALQRLELEQRILETVRHPHIIKGGAAGPAVVACSIPADCAATCHCCCHAAAGTGCPQPCACPARHPHRGPCAAGLPQGLAPLRRTATSF